MSFGEPSSLHDGNLNFLHEWTCFHQFFKPDVSSLEIRRYSLIKASQMFQFNTVIEICHCQYTRLGLFHRFIHRFFFVFFLLLIFISHFFHFQNTLIFDQLNRTFGMIRSRAMAKWFIVSQRLAEQNMMKTYRPSSDKMAQMFKCVPAGLSHVGVLDSILSAFSMY